jgi:DNA-3-methyladenine glycosylase
MKKTLKKLDKKFYSRDVLIVAKELLGKILVKNNYGKIISGKIVEVEAYDGGIDEAAHTFKGITPRNKIMFDEGGFFYVYFTYGAHFCCNVVTGVKGKGTAVLIRALEPLKGLNEMSANRFGRNLLNEREKYNLTSGPGKICQAFEINREHYGADLTGDQIYIINQPKIKEENIIISKRIGIRKSADLPWRFYIKDNPYISKK